MDDRRTPVPWNPAAADGRETRGNTDPEVFRRLPITEKVEVLAGMLGVVQSLGGSPKEMLRQVIRDMSPEEKRQVAADPVLKAQLQRLLDLLP